MNQTEHVEKEIRKVYESKTTRRVIKIGVVIILALVIFQAGQFVGLKRAEFSFRMADNYYNNFDSRFDRSAMIGASRPGMIGSPNFTESHGAAGKIISISLPTIVVSSPDNIEKTIYISSSTIIREYRNLVQPAGLKVDDFVVAVGEPTNKGQIEAKFIRVMPQPMMNRDTASSTEIQ